MSGHAERRFWEFFTAQIRNRNTRHAYLGAVRRFAGWCEGRGLALGQVEPVVVAAYIEELTRARDRQYYQVGILGTTVTTRCLLPAIGVENTNGNS